MCQEFCERFMKRGQEVLSLQGQDCLQVIFRIFITIYPELAAAILYFKSNS